MSQKARTKKKIIDPKYELNYRQNNKQGQIALRRMDKKQQETECPCQQTGETYYELIYQINQWTKMAVKWK